jgi:tRNA 2-selenouridine synthase
MAKQNEIPELFERLMRNHYDPAYRRSTLRNYPTIASSPSIAIHDLSQAGLLLVSLSMRSQFEN